MHNFIVYYIFGISAIFLIMKYKHIQEHVNIQGTKDSLEITFAVLNDSTQFETFFVIVVPL